MYKITDSLERYGRLCYTETDTRCGWTCPVISKKCPEGMEWSRTCRVLQIQQTEMKQFLIWKMAVVRQIVLRLRWHLRSDVIRDRRVWAEMVKCHIMMNIFLAFIIY